MKHWPAMYKNASKALSLEAKNRGLKDFFIPELPGLAIKFSSKGNHREELMAGYVVIGSDGPGWPWEDWFPVAARIVSRVAKIRRRTGKSASQIFNRLVEIGYVQDVFYGRKHKAKDILEAIKWLEKGTQPDYQWLLKERLSWKMINTINLDILFKERDKLLALLAPRLGRQAAEIWLDRKIEKIRQEIITINVAEILEGNCLASRHSGVVALLQKVQLPRITNTCCGRMLVVPELVAARTIQVAGSPAESGYLRRDAIDGFFRHLPEPSKAGARVLTAGSGWQLEFDGGFYLAAR